MSGALFRVSGGGEGVWGIFWVSGGEIWVSWALFWVGSGEWENILGK